jgi:hypothetical protein
MIDELQADEDARLGGIEPGEITAQMIRDTAAAINAQIKAGEAGDSHDGDNHDSGERGGGAGSGAVNRKKRSIVKKLVVEADKAQRYEEYEELFAGRNSFSKTDPDATFMRMKEDMRSKEAKPRAGYNIQIGTENQFILAYTAHHVSSDQTTFVPHLDHVNKMFGCLPRTIVADAGYGCEENYAYMEDHELVNVVKYPSWYRETTNKLSPFNKDVWEYDPRTDEYVCPDGRRLVLTWNSSETTSTGYIKQMSHYESKDCTGCQFLNLCVPASSKTEPRRSITTSRRYNELVNTARTNLSSKQGKELRAKRNVEVETVFGNIKANFHLKRFTHRSKTKILTEWGFTALAHNLKKLANLQKTQPAT